VDEAEKKMDSKTNKKQEFSIVFLAGESTDLGS
jgi:hypothetical protein